jgi:hypothetical protein
MNRYRVALLQRVILISVAGASWGIGAEGAPTTVGQECPDCKGKKKVPCKACKQLGMVKAPCPKCNDKGKMPCDALGCIKGKTTCSKCNGTGTRRGIVGYDTEIVGKTAKRIIKKPRYGPVPCDKTETCGKCKGKGTIVCDECEGIKKKVPCPECLKSGKVTCARCEGTGRIAPAPTPDQGRGPNAPPDRSNVEQLVVRLRTCSTTITQSDARAKQLALDMEAISDRYAGTNAIIESTADPSVDQDARDTMQQPWLALGKRAKTLTNDLQMLEKADAESEKHLRDVQALRARLTSTGDQEVRQQSVQEHENYASKYRGHVDDLDRRVKNLKQALDQLAPKVDSWAEKSRVKSEKLDLDRKMRGEIAKAYAKLEAPVAEMAESAGLPEFTMAPVGRSTKSPREICIEATYFDKEAKDAENEEAIVPSEEHLEKIPSFIEEVLSTRTEVKSVRLSIQTNHLSKTGINRPLTIQSFTFTRSPTWTDLMVGEYKNDWRRILSLCGPDPPYPRSTSGLPSMELVMILFLILAAVAGLVLILARFQMLRRI